MGQRGGKRGASECTPYSYIRRTPVTQLSSSPSLLLLLFTPKEGRVVVSEPVEIGHGKRARLVLGGLGWAKVLGCWQPSFCRLRG